MAMDTSKLHLPKTVATAVVNKVKETSTIAALSPSSPQIFTDKEYMIFNGAAEADVTAEGQTKSSYEQDLNYVSGKTFKVQTTTRVTSELKWADEDNRFQIIQSIQADQAEAIGRALDYVVYHADNAPYRLLDRYQVTAIYKNPDSDLPHRLAMLPMCAHDRHFTAENLNHDIFNLYY